MHEVVSIAAVEYESAYWLNHEASTEKNAIPNKTEHSGEFIALELFKVSRVADEGGEEDFIGSICGEVDSITKITQGIGRPSICFMSRSALNSWKALNKSPFSKGPVGAAKKKNKVAVDGFEDEAVFPILYIAIEFPIGDSAPFSCVLKMPMNAIVPIAGKDFST